MFGDLAFPGELDRQLKMYQPHLYEPFYQEDRKLKAQMERLLTMEMGRMVKITEHMEKTMHVTEEGTPKYNRVTNPAD